MVWHLIYLKLVFYFQKFNDIPQYHLKKNPANKIERDISYSGNKALIKNFQ